MSYSELYFPSSGIPQGKLIKRQRLPKNDLGEYWHWKDLNLGINVTFYGKVFHLYDCDAWTKVQTNNVWPPSSLSQQIRDQQYKLRQRPFP